MRLNNLKSLVRNVKDSKGYYLVTIFGSLTALGLFYMGENLPAVGMVVMALGFAFESYRTKNN